MKVRHPDFPDLVREVGDGKSWLAAGWVPVESQPYIVGEKRTELLVPAVTGRIKPAPEKKSD